LFPHAGGFGGKIFWDSVKRKSKMGIEHVGFRKIANSLQDINRD
jgi:hypothetical protein